MYVSKFYQKFYQQDPITPAMWSIRKECCASVPLEVRKEMNQELMRPFTLEEIQQATTSPPWGKTHGRDGLPI